MSILGTEPLSPLTTRCKKRLGKDCLICSCSDRSRHGTERAIKVIETHVDNMETEKCGHLVIWSFGHFDIFKENKKETADEISAERTESEGLQGQPGKDIRAWLCARAPCRKAREKALALWPGKAGKLRPGDCGPGGRRAYLYRARCAAVRHPAGGACPDASGPAEVCEAEAQCPSVGQPARGSCAPAAGAG